MENLNVGYQDIAVVIGELIGIGLLALMLNWLVTFVFRRLLPPSWREEHAPRLGRIEQSIRGILLLIAVLLALLSAAFNGYLIYQNLGVYRQTLALLNNISADFWYQLGGGLLAILVLMWLAKTIVPRIEKLLKRLEEWEKTQEQIKANDDSLKTFFSGINAIQKNSLWALAVILPALVLPLPSFVFETLFTIFKIYLIIAVGRLIVTAIVVVVDTVDALAERYTRETRWEAFYEHLQSLKNLLRRTLEYVTYVLVATLAIGQVQATAPLAAYGPILVQVIGIFFLSRVFIEASGLIVDRLLLRRSKQMTDLQWQQRLTLAPLIRSFLKYAIYSGAFLLVLRAFDVNTTPILAAIGGLGLVIGLGAQPVINDLVSGVFILIENLYLVGDFIQTGEAIGYVEAIDIRTTRLRDPDGQVHILRNGQLGDVVNFSKEYVYAVVEIGVAYESNLDLVYRVITETGQKLHETNEDALQPTHIEGVSDFADSAIAIRTITKTKPGRHREVGFAFRKLLKEAFDREEVEIPFPQRVVTFKSETAAAK